eukprot:1630883-Amphidinium_carterae.1
MEESVRGNPCERHDYLQVVLQTGMGQSLVPSNLPGNDPSPTLTSEHVEGELFVDALERDEDLGGRAEPLEQDKFEGDLNLGGRSKEKLHRAWL